MKTNALLKKGFDVGYWESDDFECLDLLADRGLQAVAKLQRYLRSPAAKRNASGRYRENNAERSERLERPNGPNDPNA